MKISMACIGLEQIGKVLQVIAFQISILIKMVLVN